MTAVDFSKSTVADSISGSLAHSAATARADGGGEAGQGDRVAAGGELDEFPRGGRGGGRGSPEGGGEQKGAKSHSSIA